MNLSPLKNPKIVSISPKAAELLDLDIKKSFEEQEDFLIGNKLAGNSEVKYKIYLYCLFNQLTFYFSQ